MPATCTNPSIWSEATDNKVCYFCFTMIRQWLSFYFGWIYLIMIFGFLYLTIRQIRKYRQNMFTLVSGVYFILVLWAIFCIIQTIYSQILFLIAEKLWGEEIVDIQTNNQKMVLISNYLIFFITFSQVFLLNTSIMMGSYHWHSNLINYMIYNNSGSSQLSLLQNQQLQRSFDNKINKFISRYLPIRQVILLIWAISLIVVSTCPHSLEKVKYIFGILTYFMVMLDSLVICDMFIVRFVLLRKNQTLKQQMGPQEFKKLTIKFIFIILSTLIETIMFIVRNPQIIQNNNISFPIFRQKCVYPNQNQQKYDILTLFLIIFEAMFINLLPAYLILRLYTYSQKTEMTVTEQNQKYEILTITE